MMNLSERIKNIRGQARLKQKEIAEEVGVSLQTVGRWERGERHPDAEELQKLAVTLNTSVAYILGETDDPSPPAQALYNAFSLEDRVTHHIHPADIYRAVTESPEDTEEENPLRKASKKLLDAMNDDQLRKAYEYLRDQKQLAELLKEKGA